jgi:tetratricopeptide (TPR) repeat protein
MRAAQASSKARGDKDGAIDRYKKAHRREPERSDRVERRSATRTRHRGDAASAIAQIEKEIEHAEGKLARARLYAEAARLYREKLSDNDKATDMARKASDLDPTNAEAFVLLGDVAFEAERYLEASKLYETLVTRTQVLARDEAVRVLTRYVEAFSRAYGARPSSPSAVDGPASGPPSSSAHPRVNAAIEALHKLAPDDADGAGQPRPHPVRATAIPRSAEGRLQSEYLAKADPKLSPSPSTEYRPLPPRRERTRRAGDLYGAILPSAASRWSSIPGTLASARSRSR